MDNTTQVSILPQKLLTAVDIAKVLNISRAFAYQLMRTGKIRTVFIEGARRVRPEDLSKFIEESLYPQATVET